jgi:hypothetical protein
LGYECNAREFDKYRPDAEFPGTLNTCETSIHCIE